MRDEDFERFYEQHAEGLFAFLMFRTSDRALTEDVLADTFERVLRSRRRYDPRKAGAKTWIYTIALNRLRDHHRRRQAEARALQRAAPPALVDAQPAPLEAVEARDAVARAMAGLSDEEREAIALRYGGELTVPEIAQLMRERLSTVEGRVYRALRKLRDELT